MFDEDSIDEQIDPRIKGELEALNESTDAINSLETRLTTQRGEFERALTNATTKLDKLTKKYGKAIDRARPYYATKQEVAKAHFALQRAVNNFQRANGVHRAAKETIALAELRLREFGDQKVDTAWQEMLNMQTIRFSEAEKDRSRSEKLHEQAAKKYDFLQRKLYDIEKRHKKSTARTRPYFELKESMELDLQKKRHSVEQLQRQVDAAKRRYRTGLNNLEKISAEIHGKRKEQDKTKLLCSSRESIANYKENDLINSLQLDIVGPKKYDNLDDLERELNEFEMNGENRILQEEECSSDSESDSETQSPPPVGDLRFPKRNPTVSRSKSVDVNSSRRHRKMLSVDQSIFSPVAETENESMTEHGENYKSDSDKNIMNAENDEEKATYQRLHGTNVDTTKLKINESSDEFDIFDELC